MVQPTVVGAVAGVGSLVVAPLVVWRVKRWFASLAYQGDVEEVREMARSAHGTAEDALRTADETRDDLDSLVGQLVESTSDVDTPLLARIQNDLEQLRSDVNDMQSEMRRQSRVETEQTVNLGRLVDALEGHGVDVDDDLRDELDDRLPDGGTEPLDPQRRPPDE